MGEQKVDHLRVLSLQRGVRLHAVAVRSPESISKGNKPSKEKVSIVCLCSPTTPEQGNPQIQGTDGRLRPEGNTVGGCLGEACERILEIVVIAELQYCVAN